MLWVHWCQFAVALANKVKTGLAFWKLGIYHGVYFDCIIHLRGYIDLLDTSVIVFVNNLLWFVFHFILFALFSAWSLVSFAGFQGLAYLHEFSFILFFFIIIFIFILNNVLIVRLGIFIYYKMWILLNIYCLIWNYFVTCLKAFWGVMS